MGRDGAGASTIQLHLTQAFFTLTVRISFRELETSSSCTALTSLRYSRPLPHSGQQVSVDYPAALALRQMPIVQDELPKYLLALEVSALLHYVPDLHRKMLGTPAPELMKPWHSQGLTFR